MFSSTPRRPANNQQGAFVREQLAANAASLAARLAAAEGNEEQRRKLLMEQARLVECALAAGVPLNALTETPTPPSEPAAPVASVQPAVAAAAPPAPPPPAVGQGAPQLKVPGGLLAAGILRTGKTDAFACWCAAYSLDLQATQGNGAHAQGRALLDDLKRTLLPLMSADRFYRLLRAAEAEGFVTRAQRRSDGATVVYYRGRYNLGLDLDLAGLGEPVWVPLEMVAQADTWKAALFATVHAGRARNPGPITRHILRELTGLPADTQRKYERLTGIAAQRNLCVTQISADHLPGLQEFGDRPGCFTYRDRDTRDDFIAWHLPNTYEVPATYVRGRSGMNRNFNRSLRRRHRLLNGGWQGALLERKEQRFPKVFYADAEAAVRALKKQANAEIPGIPSGLQASPPPQEHFAPAQWHTPRNPRFTRAGHGVWRRVGEPTTRAPR